MPIDHHLLLYGLAKTFSELNIEISETTQDYIDEHFDQFNDLNNLVKIYYLKYSLQLTQNLLNYLDKVYYFEINTDKHHEVSHHFRLFWGNEDTSLISIDHNTINTNNIIPEKLMKICGYKKNTNICKSYTEQYQNINFSGYKKIKSKEKYSEVSPQLKNTAILEPVCDLVMATLSKKRKCSFPLFQHLFSESNRIVFKLYKNRYTMYDFSETLGTVESYRMKLYQNNEIVITFNNKTKFSLFLQINATNIKEHLSLKFHTNFSNMDDFFAIMSGTV